MLYSSLSKPAVCGSQGQRCCCWTLSPIPSPFYWLQQELENLWLVVTGPRWATLSCEQLMAILFVWAPRNDWSLMSATTDQEEDHWKPNWDPDPIIFPFIPILFEFYHSSCRKMMLFFPLCQSTLGDLWFLTLSMSGWVALPLYFLTASSLPVCICPRLRSPLGHFSILVLRGDGLGVKQISMNVLVPCPLTIYPGWYRSHEPGILHSQSSLSSVWWITPPGS